MAQITPPFGAQASHDEFIGQVFRAERFDLAGDYPVGNGLYIGGILPQIELPGVSVERMGRRSEPQVGYVPPVAAVVLRVERRYT